MRRENHVVERHQRVISRQGLLVEHVQRSAADPAVHESFGDRGLVHHRPARDVHQHCIPAHARDPRLAREALGFGGKRAGEDDEVALGEQPVDTHARHIFREIVHVALETGGFHAEPVAADSGDDFADGAYAHDTDGLAGEFHAIVRDHARGVPAPGPHQRVHAVGRAREHQHRRDHVFGHGLRIRAGHVGHGDAELGGRFHGDQIHPGAVADHAFETMGTLEQVVGQLRAHDEDVAIGDHGAQGLGLHVGRNDEIGNFPDDVFADRDRRVGQYDFRAGHCDIYFFSLETSGEAIGMSDSKARAARNTSASA